jgi:multidrug efflux pump subunit AcrA (membrane-fusion protein)
MKTWKKVAIGVGVLAVAGIAYAGITYQLNKGVVKVQSGKVVRQDLTSIVTASGEIRPKNYTNVMGEGFGKITEITAKEGDHVKKGDVLMHLENIQPGADVQAQLSAIQAAEAGMTMPLSRSASPTSKKRNSIGNAHRNSTRNSSFRNKTSMHRKLSTTAQSPASTPARRKWSKPARPVNSRVLPPNRIARCLPTPETFSGKQRTRRQSTAS